MLYTSFELAQRHNACDRSLATFLGVKEDEHKIAVAAEKYGRDKLIPLIDVLNVLGVKDCLWAFRATTDEAQAKIMAVKFAIACADRVLIHYESKYPGYNQPREAIEAARNYLLNPSKETADAAYAAAYAAADAAYAAAYAAADAAYAAARAVEGEWQVKKLKELLEES